MTLRRGHLDALADRLGFGGADRYSIRTE